jgi:hypothetical protein
LLPAFMLVSCLAYSSTLKMEATCFSETSVDFQGLHGVIFQKIELFITTAVRTSNHTRSTLDCLLYVHLLNDDFCSAKFTGYGD